MSKTTTDTVETTEDTSTSSSSSSTTTKKEKKYTVYRYLQLRPQPTGYGTLLKNHHGMELHTLDEWDALLEAILNRKVKN
jgi:hypothetical protein